MANRIVTVSPSSFGFLYDECRRCYYDDVHGLCKRPRAPFPAIFSKIDAAMKRYFDSQEWYEIQGHDMRFRIESQGRWVRSQPIPVPSSDLSLVIRGMYDSILQFEDGRRAICDFKTSSIRPDLVPKYARQLHAYAFALENAHDTCTTKVESLGLAVFEPDRFRADALNVGTLTGQFAWVPVEKDDASFHRFVAEVGTLISGERPATNSDCAFCAYRGASFGR